jgi:hypothetical protein
MNVQAAAEPQMATCRPLEPLPPPDRRKWRRVSAKPLTYALGNLAVVEEISGNKLEAAQTWRWRIIKFGAPAAQKVQGLEARSRAMRAAEFLLGVGEMEVEK